MGMGRSRKNYEMVLNYESIASEADLGCKDISGTIMVYKWSGTLIKVREESGFGKILAILNRICF